MSRPGQVTLLLRKLRGSDRNAADQLADLVYSELRRIAAAKMRSERPGHTLTPTALVNEAWLHMREIDHTIEDRSHFFATAATAMRRLLIDRARARRTAKRGRGAEVSLDDLDAAAPEREGHLLALDEALNRLQEANPRASKVVELRYFGGLTHEEIAAVIGLERRTVDRDWAFARAWLYNALA